jgi:hypothetical protein
MIGSSVRGSHETGGVGAWFSLPFALIQFKILLVNAIAINIKSSIFTRLVSANGIRDRIVGKRIIRLDFARSPSSSK